MGSAAGVFSIIPRPRHEELRPGRFTLDAHARLFVDRGLEIAGARLAALIANTLGRPASAVASPQSAGSSIALLLDPTARDSLGGEGYRLSIQPGRIEMRAATQAGALYAVQSLRQLLPVEIENGPRAEPGAGAIPCGEIEDTPRFPWRGFMLDEGRHFHGRETVKLLLELMSLHKLNVFHWHLTEDQGWRIEIRRFPELTQIGATKKGTMRSPRGMPDSIALAGFYSQDAIRDIVAYAAERSITIVPEIDFPGHARSALAACPWLGCTRGPYEVWDQIGIQPDIMCAGRETTFEFLEKVLEEVNALFPGHWIHVGGDEAPKKRWKECPDCRARMGMLGLTEPDELQTWMTNRVAALLRSRGRGAIAWNDSLGPALDPGVRIQYWLRHRKGLVAEVRRGREMVASSFWDTYLDHGYALTPLSRAYAYEPVFPELDEGIESRVLGIEAPAWTEMIPDRARLWYQVFPRLCAYAETGWTPREVRNYAFFRTRLPGLLARIRALGASHAPLDVVEPGAFRRAFGVLSIYQEQSGVALEGTSLSEYLRS
jgi:hexosaminidase